MSQCAVSTIHPSSQPRKLVIKDAGSVMSQIENDFAIWTDIGAGGGQRT